MTLPDISLPVDVPWTLLATSNDMLASHTDHIPHAMPRSSLAGFKYDPDTARLPDTAEAIRVSAARDVELRLRRGQGSVRLRMAPQPCANHSQDERWVATLRGRGRLGRVHHCR